MLLLHGASVDHMDIFLLLVNSYQRHRRRTHEHAMRTRMLVAMADGNRGKTGGKNYFHSLIFDYVILYALVVRSNQRWKPKPNYLDRL